MYRILTDYHEYIVYAISLIASLAILFVMLKQKYKLAIFALAIALVLAIPLPYSICSLDSGHCGDSAMVPTFYFLYAISRVLPFGFPSGASIISLIIGYVVSVVIGLRLMTLPDDGKRYVARGMLVLLGLAVIGTAGAWLRVKLATPGNVIDAFIAKRDALVARLPALEKNRNSYADSNAYTKASQESVSLLPEAYLAICRDPSIEKFSNKQVVPSSLIGSKVVHPGFTQAATCINGYIAFVGDYSLRTCWDPAADFNTCIATYADAYDKTGAFCEAQSLQRLGMFDSGDDHFVKEVTRCRNGFQKVFGTPSAGSDHPAGYDPRSAQERSICGQSFIAQGLFDVPIDRVDPEKKEIWVRTGSNSLSGFYYEPEKPPKVMTKDCKEESFNMLGKDTPIDIYTTFNVPLTAIIIQDKRNYSTALPDKPVRVEGTNADYNICGQAVHGQLAENQIIWGEIISQGSLKGGMDSFWGGSTAFTFRVGGENLNAPLYDKNCKIIPFSSLKVDDIVDVYTVPLNEEWSKTQPPFINAQAGQKRN